MNQDDFRHLLSTSDTPSAVKRSRDTAFGRRPPPSSSTPILAPRQADKTSRIRVKPEKSLLAEGYVDRTKERGQDPRHQKLEELKALVKVKAISHKQYLERVQALGSGDVEDAGVVRGLDRKLLERVRAGEDVFQSRTAVAEAEAELERLLEERIIPTRKASRSELLASLAPSKYRPIAKPNKDGTTTEVIEENGRKTKIIRDAKGHVIKKLVKKVKLSDLPGIDEAGDMSEGQTRIDDSNKVVDDKHDDVIQKGSDDSHNDTVQKEVDDSHNVIDGNHDSTPQENGDDIFEDAGTDYNPFDTADAIVPVQKKGAYFIAPEEEEETALPSNTAEFLKQNNDALVRASAIVDRQAKVDQEALRRKNADSAGFGLVFRESAYDADLREVPDEDDMLVEKKRGKKPS